jgi:8-oxo-dGTP diphosphatase
VAPPKTPLLTVDCVARDGEGRILLVRRKNPPYRGAFALPGGFVEIGEKVEAACRREVLEETGIAIGEIHLLGVYSGPGRDPRGHTVSVVYMTLLPEAPEPQAGSDAEAASWVSDWRKLDLAFDHAKIIAEAEKIGPQ